MVERIRSGLEFNVDGFLSLPKDQQDEFLDLLKEAAQAPDATLKQQAAFRLVVDALIRIRERVVP